MASRKLLMLAFIRDYIGRWGGSPSISEIAQGTKSGRDTVKKALRYLEAEGLIIRRPGARGIVLPDRLADALRELRAAGFIVDEDVVRSPFPPLPPVPELDYDPG
ncbi:LexA family protein [Sphingomonas sp. Leaf257]|uniref:LexA family protein n=1 Tax=Sphingomonas sp. Leaf257 TaxID=1736309 RepID=UPI0014439084|nr:GntR family transcriptional regulator [Sphingomonas sp. Leaf257]